MRDHLPVKRRVVIRRIVSIAILTVVVTGMAAIGLNGDVFAGFQRRATDALFPAAPDDGDIAVVGFDTKTIDPDSGLGYPLPREKVAVLVDNLKAAGARVIAFDVIYRSASATPGADAAMRNAIDSAGNVVLAEEPTIGPARDGVYTTTDLSPIAPEIAQTTGATVGQVHLNKDPSDGISRSVPLVVSSPDDSTFVPALSVAAVMMYRGLDPSQFIVRPHGLQIGDRLVPTDDAKSMLLNFSPDLSGTSEVIPAVDVINGTFPKKKVAGKIVFVGATATTLGDVKTAPVNKSTDLPGVMFHANAANTMLTGTYLEPVSNSQTLLWVAALTALIGTAVLLLPLWMSIVFTVLILVGYVVYAFQQFNSGNVLNFVYPSLAVIVAFMGALGVRYFGETRQRRHITTLFSQYVPEAVAQRLVDEDRASIAVEGERLDMTVLFCDLRGFTAMSENLEPAVVRTMLNVYYDRVTDVVLAMEGTLMKYVGDEVFAVWGAPLPSSDHPTRALECAIAIQALTPDLNRELVEQGAPEVSFGIGLNTGEAVAAHFGGGRRRQYDVVGNTVNVGARLCSAAGRGDIILSDQVLTRVLSPPPVEPVGRIELKGVSRELQLWRVVRSESAILPESVVGREAAAAVPEG
ncbi:MAG: adenylate/guanylate cyclase domain-containing protein [Acidimicrobiia bacterium]